MRMKRFSGHAFIQQPRVSLSMNIHGQLYSKAFEQFFMKPFKRAEVQYVILSRFMVDQGIFNINLWYISVRVSPAKGVGRPSYGNRYTDVPSISVHGVSLSYNAIITYEQALPSIIVQQNKYQSTSELLECEAPSCRFRFQHLPSHSPR